MLKFPLVNVVLDKIKYSPKLKCILKIHFWCSLIHLNQINIIWFKLNHSLKNIQLLI